MRHVWRRGGAPPGLIDPRLVRDLCTRRCRDAAAYDPAGDRIARQLQFAVSGAGFARFLTFLGELGAEPMGLVVGLEATAHYHLTLAEFLAGLGYPVVLLNPGQVTQFRRAEGHRAKTDRIDARSLARFLAVSAPDPTPQPDETLAGLRELTRFRTDLAHDRTATVNRLHGAVDLAFPELPGVRGSLTSRSALALLAAFPTASAVTDAPEVVAVLLREASRGQVRAERATALVAAAHASIVVRRGETALGAKVSALARQVAALDREIAAVERAIAAEFATLGYPAGHFPISGIVALATILAEAGPVARYPSVKQFLAHVGWCPTDRQSGTYKNAHPRLSKAGNRHVRRIIWLLAVGAMRHPGPYRDYFDRRTAAGKNKMDSLVAVGRTLLTTIYAILKSGRPADPAYRSPGAPSPGGSAAVAGAG